MCGALADPQVGGQVGVWRQGIGTGGVVEGLFAVDAAIGAGFSAAGLRQDGQLAQLQARDGKDRLTLPVDDAGGMCRIAPAGQQGLADGFGEPIQPLAVACQWQRCGQAICQKQLQQGRAFLAVGGGQQALQPRDEFFLGRQGRDVVAGLAQGVGGAAQAARDVHVRGRQVLLAGGIVPEHQRQLLLTGGLALQARQGQGTVGHGLGLGRNGHHVVVGLAGGGGDLNVGDAGVFGLGQEEGNFHHRQALGVGLPGSGIAMAVSGGLDDGQAQFREFAAPSFGVEHDLGVDDHVGQGRPVFIGAQQLAQAALGQHAVEDRHGDGALLLDACHQVVDHAGLDAVQVLTVHQDGNGGGTLVVHAAPAQEGGHVGKHQVRGFGVIDAHLRDLQRWWQVGRCGLMVHGAGQQTEEALEVAGTAVDVVGHQRLCLCIGEALPGGALGTQPDEGRLQLGQRTAQVGTHVLLQRGFDEDGVIATKDFRAALRGDAVQVTALHGQPVGGGQLFQVVELAPGNVVGGHEQQAVASGRYGGRGVRRRCASSGGVFVGSGGRWKRGLSGR